MVYEFETKRCWYFWLLGEETESAVSFCFFLGDELMFDGGFKNGKTVACLVVGI